ncbi:carbon storage regulator CsrA [Paenibacillus sediminis]|uniref:Translational regulator CsrA n=1 Tax=Paenibacillus sediminis TaxID=664909 RepID=A0ABS4H295_9BACL|nr:carbon storage regulator CsrA [Paenibacillus sediminis]MBP1936659.1 carbon storage regulator [Paenibacillus sediminis]
MLILSRKRGQSILINNDIEIYIASIEGDNIKVGIRAPEDIVILRKELVEEVQANNQEASSAHVDPNLLKKMKF